MQQNKFFPLLLSVLTGGLLSLCWYPFFTFLAFVAFIPLFLLVHHISLDTKIVKKGWAVYLYTFMAFSLWNIGVYWWLWYASSWTTLAAWLANAALQSLPVLLYYKVKRISHDRFGLFFFIISFISFEYLHLHWQFSWVWLNIGNIFANTPSWVQWYEYTGAFGGALWILGVNSLIYQTIFKRKYILLTFLVLFVPLLLSFYRYYTYQPVGDSVEVIAIQPNIDCYTEKFTYNASTGGDNSNTTYIPYEKQVERLLSLSAQSVTPQTQFILFPETALHESKDEARLIQYPDVQAVRSFRQQHPQVSILSGMDSYKLYPDKATSSARYDDGFGYYDVFNSAFFLSNKDSNQVEIYDKSQLVIGAETVPYPFIFNLFLLNFGGVNGGLGRQDERVAFCNNQKICAAPVICYESVYGEFVTEYVQKGATFIAVITNDGWWNTSPGHKQHLAYSRLRAIENRKDVVRAANTGVSCFIDQRGEVTQSLAYGTQGALKGTVLSNHTTTFYGHSGDYLGRLAAFLCVAIALSVFVKNKIMKKK